MKRPAALILVGVAVAAVLVLSRPPSAAATTDRLPDLAMARLRDLSIDTATLLGRRLLRFSTVIVNVGDGPFETIGSRPDTQRIFNTAGSSREVNTPAVMFWAGDGHDHWHLRDLEAYRLSRLDNGRRVGTGASMGSATSTTPPTGSGCRERPAPRYTAAAARQGTCESPPGSRSAGVTSTRPGSPSSGSTSPG